MVHITEGPFGTKAVVVADSGTTSAALDVRGYIATHVLFPSGLDGTTFEVEGSMDGTNFFDLYDNDETQVTMTVAASRISTTIGVLGIAVLAVCGWRTNWRAYTDGRSGITMSGYRHRRGGLDPLMLRRGGGVAPFVGAYDTFAASLAHVYEPARRTLTAYTGSLLRLRRASDDAESNFGYVAATGDLDVAAIAAWAVGNSYVVTVYDQTTNADHVTQADKTRQPLFVASAQNGHAGMLLDGSSDYLKGAYTIALSQPFNIFAIAKLDISKVNYDSSWIYLCDGDDSTNRSILAQTSTATPDTWGIYSGNILNGANASNALVHIWTASFNGGTSQFWLDTISQATGNAGTQNADGLAIGCRNTGGAEYWMGYINSIIACDPALSTADRQAMELAMNTYWAVY